MRGLRFRKLFRRGIMALSAMLLVLVMACGPAAATPDAASAQAPASTSGNMPGLEAIVATKVLNTGTQRFAFLLTTPTGIVNVPEVEVKSVYLGDGDAAQETKTARFYVWPYGVRGSYVTEINFDRQGPWRLDISLAYEDLAGTTQAAVQVLEGGPVPAIGSVPPLSRNKTLEIAGSLEKLTTHFTPDPELYQLTIEEAAQNGRPTLVVFASPAFCTSPTCGPQTDALSTLKDANPDRANFIHVEIYDNPDEIQGDLSKARLSQPVLDWGISDIPDWFNESWTFVLDTQGRVSHRYEGFASVEELQQALDQVLMSG